jgi:DNA-binding protein HU-beta
MAKTATAVKPLSKSEIATKLAESVGITKKQAVQFLAAQADLAYKNAKNSFVIPGIGKLVLKRTKARDMVMRFGADAGKIKNIPAKTKVKFKLAKAARDAILESK